MLIETKFNVGDCVALAENPDAAMNVWAIVIQAEGKRTGLEVLVHYSVQYGNCLRGSVAEQHLVSAEPIQRGGRR